MSGAKTVVPMRVPIVGQKPAAVHQILITVIAICGCGSRVPVVLPNVAAAATCPGCGDTFFLKRLLAECSAPGEGGLDIELGRLAAVPAPPN